MYRIQFTNDINTFARRIEIAAKWEREFHDPQTLLGSFTRADARELARAYTYARNHDPATYAMLRQYLFDELNLLVEEPETEKEPSPAQCALEEALAKIYERL